MSRPALWSILVIYGLSSSAQAELPFRVDWTSHAPSNLSSTGYDVAVDGLGSVYVTGHATGGFDAPGFGQDDAVLAKFNSAGELQWVEIAGTAERDQARGVVVDQSGNVYIAGFTEGTMTGTSFGERDSFLSKYDPEGNLQWVKQFGTNVDDRAHALAIDGVGNLYVTGYVTAPLAGQSEGLFHSFVRKFDSSGETLWTRDFANLAAPFPPTTGSLGVSPDSFGNVFIGGWTLDDLDGVSNGDSDFFIAKYNDAGELQWTRQLGSTGPDTGHGVAADGFGGAYLVGGALGEIVSHYDGGADAVLARYDTDGTLLWAKQLDNHNSVYGMAVSVDPQGNAYVAGMTQGAFGRATLGGTYDTFVSKYTPEGELLWTRQYGSPLLDYNYGVVADGLTTVYAAGISISGVTGEGELTLSRLVYTDVADVPEPSTLLLAVIGFVLLCRRPNRAR